MEVIGNFSSIGGGNRSAVWKTNASDASWALFEINDTVDFSSITGPPIRMSPKTIFIYAKDGTATAENNNINATAVLVNMSYPPGCPPSGENVQLPPMVPLLNGTSVAVADCIETCTGEDRAEWNGTHWNLCGPVFGGDTTNFTELAATGNFSNFHFVLDIPGKAKINFTQNVSMATQEQARALFEFAVKNLMSGGRIGINETEWGGTDPNRPNLTVSARLTIYNVSGRFGIAPPHMPTISRRATYGEGSFAACGAYCSDIEWDGENFTFTVSSFSEYEISKGLGLTLNSPANYSHISNSSFVSYAPFRNVNFTFTPTWNATTEVANFTLFGNFTGIWAANATNSTPITTANNATVNGINITLDADGAYIWNVIIYDTTGSSDTNTINWTVTVDTASPSYANNNVNATTVGKYDAVLIYANWTDAISLDVAVLETNETGAAKNYTGVYSSPYDINMTTGQTWSNFTWSNSSLAVGTVVEWKIYANDSAGNPMVTAAGTFQIDGTAPTIGNITTTPSSPTEYAPGKSYIFNVSVADVVGVDEVIFEWNGSTNYTSATTPAVQSLGSNNYSIILTDLGVSTTNYTYRWYANDTSDNWASSSVQTYNVTQNTTNPLNIYLNGTTGNLTLAYPAQVNATVLPVYSKSGTAYIYRDGSDVTAENATNVRLPNATYAYKFNITGNANYTSNATGATYYVFVNKGATTISLYLNDTQGNEAVTQGAIVNFTATVNTIYNVNISLTVNISSWGIKNATNSRVENLTDTTYITAANFYNVTAWFDGDENYTSSSQTYWLNISADTTSPTILVYNLTGDPFPNATLSRAGATLALNISVTDANTGIAAGSTCNISIGGTSAGTITIANSWCNGTVTVPTVSEGNQTINITIADIAGNVGVNDSYALDLDNTSPTITVTTPANNSYNNSLAGYGWINGTVYDNRGMSSENITINGLNASLYEVYSFTGANNSAFSIRNKSAINDGMLSVIIGYVDSVGNVQNVTMVFYKDTTGPTAAYGLSNSTFGSYRANSTQIVRVKVVDALQTNKTITLHYAINSSGCDKWFTVKMTGTPGTSTVYTATINTVANASGYCRYQGREYVPYYITGVDNATNSISSAVGGTNDIPFLANITINPYCGNDGNALAYCSYDEGWQGLTTGAVNQYHEVHWSSYQLSGASSLNNDYNISNVLSSISGEYSFVYYRNYSSSTTPWLSYDPNIAWNLNTLRFGNNTDVVYYINVTAPGAVIRIA